MKKHLLNIFAISTLIIAASVSAPAMTEEQPLETVPYVDLNRYLGKWYEIASFPQQFSKGCTATTATYSLKKNGDIDVLNECRLERIDGQPKSARGTAKVVDKKTNAKLKVSFFGPFYGKYWIIDLGEQYEFAVVGHPDRNYLWILSRTPRMDEAKFQAILDRVEAKGFDLEKLQLTPQP